MVYFDWDEFKNRKLREERDISFEEVLIAIEEGHLLDVLEHPNPKRYPGQRIIPSRKATKHYLIERFSKN